MTTEPDLTPVPHPPVVASVKPEAAALASTGVTVAIELPDGTVVDLWLYADAETASVDVRYRANAADVNTQAFLPIPTVMGMGGDERGSFVAVAVLR